MNYSVLVARAARHDLRSLPAAAYERVWAAIETLRDTPRPNGCIRLTGRAGWRTRVGDYRIIYTIDDAAHTVMVLRVGQRGGVYR